ncbi:hypothetical protein BH24ACT16_BH24ACT16_16720 [soil metagenome]
MYNPLEVSPGALVWTFSYATRLPVLCVPVFVAVGIAGADSVVSGLLWAALCVTLTAGLSTFYLEYLRRNVRLGDPVRLSQGGEIRPVRVIAVLYVVAWTVITLLGVPFGLGSLVLLYALLVVLAAILAPEEEISLHAGAVCGAAVALTHAFGPWGLLTFSIMPLPWWARTATGRHTPEELAFGALAGTIGALAIFLLTAG